MTQDSKKAAKLTTDQAIRKLFPKPVVDAVKREIETDTGGGTSEKQRSRSTMKRD
jgi:hypothetical protein